MWNHPSNVFLFMCCDQNCVIRGLVMNRESGLEGKKGQGHGWMPGLLLLWPLIPPCLCCGWGEWSGCEGLIPTCQPVVAVVRHCGGWCYITPL